MRILVISNFYPPNTIGGMENRCQQVVDGLRARGHQLKVLTSNYGAAADGELGIQRRLHLESDLDHYRPLKFFRTYATKNKQNIALVANAIKAFSPDVIFIWGMWNLSPNVARVAEECCPGAVVYSMAQDWVIQPDTHRRYWGQDANRPIMRQIKKLATWRAEKALSRESVGCELTFQHVICVSETFRDILLSGGAPLDDSTVVYPGIDIDKFNMRNAIPKQPAALKLLYAGNLAEHKGVHTIIEAMGALVEQACPVGLTILGKGHPQYVAELHEMIDRYGINHRVTFREWVPREEMPDLMKNFDILLFPSTWQEPFSRMVLEAMATGLIVIGTPNGGTKEIVRDGETGLLFTANDAVGLANQISCVSADNSLQAKIRKNARELVQNNFTLDRMVDEMEAYLTQVLGKTVS